MISCITYKNLHRTGKLFKSQFELRHQCFIERLGYSVSAYEGMEYDQYDTPAATYLVYHTTNDEALGVSRLMPTSHGCMIRDIWPDMINQEIKYSSNIWEGTRFCINKNLPKDLRQKISRELVLAYLELGLTKGVKQIIGVMPTLILNYVFKKAGCTYRALGPCKRIDNDRAQAAIMDVTLDQLNKVREATGINYNVLQIGLEYESFQKAA